ncbi:MAG: Rieske (2Fe-2S) domain protein [Marmoricola sp.]|nr:Rieske (2Fe-2S) domain protein [Marmoricola sp.]
MVTQPTAGEFKAFSANCTHQGTLLDQIDGTAMICPNHGSRFSIVDGSVEQGPATVALPAKTVEKKGDSLIVSG